MDYTSHKILHRGYVKIDEKVITYYTDDVDSLPAGIHGYERFDIHDFSWSAFFQEVTRGESKGFYYNIQIGDLFYETI
jgi:hypothetical protein